MEISKKIGMRILCLLAFALCLPVLARPASAAVPGRNNLAAAVYRTASTDALVIGHIRNGESLTVQGSVGDFYEIDCHGMNGFIHKDHVRGILRDDYFVSCDLTRPDTHLLNLPTVRFGL